MRRNRGSALIEYGVLLAVIVAVLIGIVPYLTGAVAGHIHAAIADLGPQYHPGRTATTATNRQAVDIMREEHVYQTNNLSLVTIPTLYQPSPGQDFNPVTTIGISSNNSKENIVVTTSNQTVTQERHERTNGVLGAPAAH